jgi:hypothetical protein
MMIPISSFSGYEGFDGPPSVASIASQMVSWAKTNATGFVQGDGVVRMPFYNWTYVYQQVTGVQGPQPSDASSTPDLTANLDISTYANLVSSFGSAPATPTAPGSTTPAPPSTTTPPASNVTPPASTPVSCSWYQTLDATGTVCNLNYAVVGGIALGGLLLFMMMGKKKRG